MSTFLFDKTIFGPVISRRLGISLGINLLPNDGKLCSFNCIYCECGWNRNTNGLKPILPTTADVSTLLEEKLKEMLSEHKLPDVITFAGNGEPTMHPQFAEITDSVLELRDKYAPSARVAVLSNATMLHNKQVVEALKKVDDNLLKLDSGIIETVNLLNNPNINYNIERQVELMKQFEGNFTLQTMFLRGEFNGKKFDNTTSTEIEAWLKYVKEAAPRKLSIYSIARDTPAQNLQKVEHRELEEIAKFIHSELPDIEIEIS